MALIAAGALLVGVGYVLRWVTEPEKTVTSTKTVRVTETVTVPAYATLAGTVVDRYWQLDTNTFATGMDTEPMVSLGDDVVVRDESGRIIGRSRLTTRTTERGRPLARWGTWTKTVDAYSFSVPDLPKVRNYVITIGDVQERWTFAFEELVMAKWRLSLEA